MWSQGTKMRQRGENRWKRKECPSKKVSVIEHCSSALGCLVQNLPRILIKLCLRIVCLRDEKKKHVSLGWHHLCAEGCFHGAATPHPGASLVLQHHMCRSREASGQEARFLIKAWDEALSAQRRGQPAQSCSPKAQLELEVGEMGASAQEASQQPGERAVSLVSVYTLSPFHHHNCIVQNRAWQRAK